ncbi:MAG: biopolymer transporter ExbD [Sulfitobacter sp.]|nr:biopolymer transporter ExbD [Sulfitobacter sp.]
MPRPKGHSEPALPMINVVFLLLIFFLMSAQIVAPPPFEVTPPEAQAGRALAEDLRLQVSATGALALGEATDASVWSALAEVENRADRKLLIRADAALPASQLAALMARLSALGFETIALATVPR